MTTTMNPDVQAFLLENRQAILSYLYNCDHMAHEDSPEMDHEEEVQKEEAKMSLQRSSSRSISPKAKRPRSRSRSPRERKRSKISRRKRSKSPEKPRPSSRYSCSPIAESSTSPEETGGKRDAAKKVDSYASGVGRIQTGKISSRDRVRPWRCLGIFGLSPRTTEERLHDIFSKYGLVENLTIVRNAYTQSSKGFGFVYFSSTSQATRALTALEDSVIDGYTVRIDYSATSGPHQSHRFGNRESSFHPRKDYRFGHDYRREKIYRNFSPGRR